MSTAYFLVSHGSGDGRSLVLLHQVRCVLQQMCPEVLIGAGCLAGQEQSLADQCAEFWAIAERGGARRGVLLPLFLLAGSHVLQDIPQALADRCAPFPVTIADYFGNFACIPHHLEQKFRLAEAHFAGRKTVRLLICHGSSQALAMQRISQLGDRLGARVALWSAPQSIGEQIGQETQTILALPYFLFPGKTTQAIADLLQGYAPQVHCLPLPFDVLEIAEILHTYILPEVEQFGSNRPRTSEFSATPKAE